MEPVDADTAQEARGAAGNWRKAQGDYPQRLRTVCPALASRCSTRPAIRRREASYGVASEALTGAAAEPPMEHKFPCSGFDRCGGNDLHWYAEEGELEAVGLLLVSGVWADTHDLRCRRNVTPLNLAAGAGHEQVVRSLLAAGAGAGDRGGDAGHSRKTTALHYAAARGHVGVVSLLLGAGFDREQQDENGSTPLDLALQAHFDPAVTRRLLPHDRGARLVQHYCDMGNVTIVQRLARGGAYLDLHDEVGDTPLHRAAHFGDVRIAEALIMAGAKTNARNLRGSTPLHVAACSGCVLIVAALLQAGSDIGSRMYNGRSPLHMAVLNNKIEVVEMLLRAGAYMEHRDHKRGQTPLAEASEYRLAPIVRALVAAGADVESRSSLGLTPLHWACRFGCPDTVETLLSLGADPDAVDGAAAKVPSLTAALDNDASRAGKPVAADVIYLGNPIRCFESTALQTIKKLVEMHRREHVSEVRRIRASLERARRQMPWRRRGWLMILARRYDTGQFLLAERHSSRNAYGESATVDSGIKRQRSCRQAVPVLNGCGPCLRAGNGGASDVPFTGRGSDNNPDSRRHGSNPTFVSDAGMAYLNCWNARSLSHQYPSGCSSTHGHAGLGEGGVFPGGGIQQGVRGTDLASAVERLLEMRAVEPGVFRHVVHYV